MIRLRPDSRSREKFHAEKCAKWLQNPVILARFTEVALENDNGTFSKHLYYPQEYSRRLRRFTATFENLGAPGKIRTPNLLIRSQTLYPVELRALRQRRAEANQSPFGMQDLQTASSRLMILARIRAKSRLPRVHPIGNIARNRLANQQILRFRSVGQPVLGKRRGTEGQGIG